MKADPAIRFRPYVPYLRCPLCAAPFSLSQNSLICTNKHCFDIAAKGYINLIPAQKPTKYTRTLFESRKQAYHEGYFDWINETVLEYCGTAFSENAPIRCLDAGCGEGYFSNALMRAGIPVQMIALDLEKEVIKMAAAQHKEICWMVADLSNLPIKDASLDLVLNIFSPSNYGEFQRVLKKDALLIKIVPGNHYLQELRDCAKSILKHPEYSNQNVIDHFEQNFHLHERRSWRQIVSVTQEQVHHFAKMTPLLIDMDIRQLNLQNVETITIDLELLIGINRPRP